MTAPRPNLFIVGAPKCGTTAWVEYLSRHPDIFFCEPKEPHYFNTDIDGFRWYRNESEYLELFERAEGKAVVGEASILYLYSKEAAANIARFNRDAKILVFVRQHGPFIASYHQQLLYNRDEDETDPASAWAMSGARPEARMPPHCRDPQLVDYKSIGAFAEQAGRYLDHFPHDRVKIIRFEEWTTNPRATYLDILGFLGLEDNGLTDFDRVNAAHRHKSELLANLTQRPPGAISRMLKLLRRVPGLGNFRPARILRALNRAEGYTAMPDPALLERIDTHYAKDAEALSASCPDLNSTS